MSPTLPACSLTSTQLPLESTRSGLVGVNMQLVRGNAQILCHMRMGQQGLHVQLEIVRTYRSA